MTLFAATFSTPLGPFSLAVDEAGALVATAFGDDARLRARLRSPAGPAAASTSASAVWRHDPKRTRVARAEIDAYFAGERRDFTLATAAVGTPFQHTVWRALREIPHGETRSYGDLARTLKTAPRAVGRANATNPICLVVPCHRVIGADGSLTGFAFGEDVKRRLLDHERAR